MEPVTYQISESEYISFWRLVSDKPFKWVMTFLGIYLLAVIGIHFLVATSYILLGIAVGVALVMLIAVIQRYGGGPRLIKATYHEDAAIQEEISLTFDEQSFSRVFASGALTSKWADMVKWHENDEVFAVFPNRQLGHIFPKAQIDPEIIGAIRSNVINSGLPVQNRLRK